jgi:acetylglutamate kinase
MNESELEAILGHMDGGMLPKLASVSAAVAAGVRRAHILDGRVQHAVLLEMFTREGIGTMVTQDGDDRE